MSKRIRWFRVIGVGVAVSVALAGWVVTNLAAGAQRKAENLLIRSQSVRLHVFGVALVEFAEANEGQLPHGEQWQDELVDHGLDPTFLVASIEDGVEVQFQKTDVKSIATRESAVVAYEPPSLEASARMRIAVYARRGRAKVSVYWIERPHWPDAMGGIVPHEDALERVIVHWSLP